MGEGRTGRDPVPAAVADGVEWRSTGGAQLNGRSSERVYQELRRMILTGRLQPSQRLVELQLATQFNVSRTPVREALKRLVAEELVTSDRFRGMVVRGVDATEIEEIYVIREALDSLAAKLAAERITSEELAKLRMLMEIMRESMQSGHWEAMVQANVNFHDVIHQAAGNRRLRALSRSLREFVRRFSTTAFTSGDRAPRVLEEHEDIIASLEAHSPERAATSARSHVSTARAYLSNFYGSKES